MTWNCPDCGFRDNEDAALRCSCGHEISLIEKNSANAEVITATYQQPLLDQVKAELAQASGQKTLLQKASVLVLSLFLFATLGLFETSLSGVIVLLIVLFIHEAGHLFGMKLFGYRDVQVFFIPFLGAAASGTEINPSSTRKAIVSLLGPIPGIILGIIAAFLFFKTKEDFFAQCASTFLFINGFNLLPFHPLDGGRFFEYLIFSRKPLYEIGFKVVTCLISGL